MNCKTFEQRLEAYLAGDLAPVERTEMEKHQVTCTHCQGAAERATRLNGLLHDGLLAAAAMKPLEQVALRDSVLSRVAKTRPSFWRGWAPRLAGLAAVLAVVIVASLTLLGRESVPTVSAAEIIARAQAAIDKRVGLSGVLHWETSIEQWGPRSGQINYVETEVWFDFDDPRRYHLHVERWTDSTVSLASSGMVRDGVDRLWKYLYYSDREDEDASFVDEIILSPEEMQEVASWHVPSPFRDDLTRFADILPDVELVGETNVAGRRAYLLRGQLFNLGMVSPDGIPRPTASTVTLTVDAETYWLLGREEVVVGEARPRTAYRTHRFELLPQDQVPDDVFTFTPPEGIQVRRLEGIDSFYYEPRLPSMTLEEAADAAPFTFLVPTALPGELEPLPHVLRHQVRQDEEFLDEVFLFICRGRPGQQMVLSESMLPTVSWGATRLVDVGGRQGWLESDLIDSRKFVLYLPDWDVAEHYVGKGIPEEPGDRLPPGGVVLQAWGLSVDEAIAVLESLEPYTP